MNDQVIQAIVAELNSLLVSRSPGKIFQLGAFTLVIDFGLREQGYLLISVDPACPRTYLVKRRVRDLEKQSKTPGHFALQLRRELSHSSLHQIQKQPDDRIVRFCFAGIDDLGQSRRRTLVVQLTGRSANLFLLDEDEIIIELLRSGGEQQVGERYSPPLPKAQPRLAMSDGDLLQQLKSGASPSETVDFYFASLLSERAFAAKTSAARAELRKKLSRQKKLLQQLKADLSTHQNAEIHRRLGDLLLANLTTAQRNRNRVTLFDYFDEGNPAIEIEVDEKSTLQEEAVRQFALYSKSKRALNQINNRLKTVETEFENLKSQQERLERAIANQDLSTLDANSNFTAHADVTEKPSSRNPRQTRIPGTRCYVSSDGFEILVGRTARDNDNLTFKIAKPNDLWLHAADYGGSHVVVRNPSRKEIPHRTIIEAAQLAAQFSQARKDPKVDVHYTQRKFVSKPKRAAPGLVRLSQFKTILVKPGETLVRS